MSINGSVMSSITKARPRIPTPDVTKEVLDRENRFTMGTSALGNTAQSVASGVALMTQQVQNYKYNIC